MEKNVKTVQIAALNDAVTFIVDEMLKNDFIFPDGEITGKDFEQVYLYAVTLFDFHDYINGRKLGESITLESFYLMFDMLKKNFSYSADQITVLQSNITEEMRKYAIAYDELISKKATEDSIRKYVSDVLQHFPSAESTSSFSFAGVAFATLVTANIKYVSETYDTLVAIPETFEKAAKKSTPTNDDFIIEDLTQKPASPKTKKPVALIVCVVALICSLRFNIYQYNQINSTKEKNIDEVLYWSKNYIEEYTAHRGAVDFLKDIKDEYFFYHNYAVIVSSPGGTKYHKHGCPHLGDRFYIYNIENAKSQGYTACADCEPDKTLTSVSNQLKKQMINEHIEQFSEKPMGPYEP